MRFGELELVQMFLRIDGSSKYRSRLSRKSSNSLVNSCDGESPQKMTLRCRDIIPLELKFRRTLFRKEIPPREIRSGGESCSSETTTKNVFRGEKGRAKKPSNLQGHGAASAYGAARA